MTTRRVIIGRAAVQGSAAGAALGSVVILVLVLGMPTLRLLLLLAGAIGAATAAAGAVAGLISGLAAAAQRDRLLLDGPRSRLVVGLADAVPFLLLLTWRSTGSDQLWPSVCLLMALWCGVAGAMFAPWVVHGTLTKAPSLHE